MERTAGTVAVADNNITATIGVSDYVDIYEPLSLSFSAVQDADLDMVA
jgi:hypothetical protein